MAELLDGFHADVSERCSCSPIVRRPGRISSAKTENGRSRALPPYGALSLCDDLSADQGDVADMAHWLPRYIYICSNRGWPAIPGPEKVGKDGQKDDQGRMEWPDQGEWPYPKRQRAIHSKGVGRSVTMLPFIRQRKGPAIASVVGDDAKGLLTPRSVSELIGTTRRQRVLQDIWQRTSLSRTQFDQLMLKPIERYAALVQEFPASESHHHSYLGGMLDHGIEIVAYAIRLRHLHLLPAGASPESQSEQADAWTAAVGYAALLHDIGKIAVDIHVEYDDGTSWHPWHGPLRRPYRFRYRREREYRLHAAAAGLLYNAILDSRILDWLSHYPAAWSALLYVLAGQYEHAGILGELVQQADQASTANDLGGDPSKARQAPKHTLQRKLLDGLRFLVREQLRLNQPEASDGWLTQEALWLVSKTVSDKLRAHLLQHGVSGIPHSNTVMFDVLQEHGLVQRTANGRAIWSATVTSATGWTHEFTFLRIAPSLIWERADERPHEFNGSVRATAEKPTAAAAPSDDEIVTKLSLPSPARAADMTDEAAAAPTQLAADRVTPSSELVAPILPQAPRTAHVDNSGTEASESPASDSGLSVGDQFMAWLRNGIEARKLIINDSMALVHTVNGTAYLVTPGIFQRYEQEHAGLARGNMGPELQDWELVQKSFERLRLHRRQQNGFNIWTCRVAGPRRQRRVHGYLLLDGHMIFGAGLPNDNPYLSLET